MDCPTSRRSRRSPGRGRRWRWRRRLARVARLQAARAYCGGYVTPGERHHRSGPALRWVGRGRACSQRGGARAPDRLARLRRERRRAARRLRRLRTRRASRRSRSRTRDEGQARDSPRASPSSCSNRARAGRRAVPALRDLRRLPLPGSRVRRAARARRSSRCATRSSGSDAIPDPPLEPIVPAASEYGYRNKLEYSFTTERGRRRSRLSPRRALGRGDRDRGVPADDRPRQRHPARGSRLGARGAARAVRPGDRRGIPAPSRRSRRPEHGPGARGARHGARASTSRAGYFVDVLRRFPEVRSIHWAINDTPAEQTNLPTRLLWGEEAIEEEILGLRFRVRPSAFLQTNTEMAERLYELAREFAALTGTENVFDLYCGTGTIGLALAARARAASGGWRSPRRRSRARSRTPS